MPGRLDGKVTIVTGGNSGIGEATSHLFAKEGAKVILMARREEQGIEVQNSIRTEGGEATFIQCDVANVDSVERAVEQATGIYDSVDILFNNAGHGSGGDFPESVYDGLYNTVDFLSWGSDTKRMILVIGDAPPLEGSLTTRTLSEVVDICNDMDVVANLYPILIGG